MKLPSAYEPSNYEEKMYALWQQGGVFAADPESGKPHFSISMPPPNETATLHLGSALFVTLQDILTRHARQKGYDALWLPGTDHAAIATNTLVEKRLAEQGISKHDIGRDEFIKRVKEFSSQNRQGILHQFRAIGASCDWSRTRYTLDDTLNRCVNETFVKMYNDDLIYRGHRIVNWDPKMETTVSDDEVEHKEEKTPFYTLQFGPFQISTARPETKFGDKYVVMNPRDERYSQFHDGDTFECEWINGKITATVVKDEAVDPSFGTGVMTITPWHDHTDFEIAERHGLEKTQVIDFAGKLLPIAGEFEGLGIEEARPKIIEKLQAKGLVVAIDENYVHNIATNSRGGGVIEPQIKLQWFVDVNRPVLKWGRDDQLMSLKEVMRAVIDDKDIEIIPKRFDKIYFHWIDNLRDWCISRQIWWGHRIPVWYKGEEIHAGVLPPEGDGWEQDPDTLDTWFSSALWTWSTLIDQELAKDQSLSLDELLARSQDFQTYHPTSVLETGWDILFFWVARMILATTYMTGQVPFKKVYLHGLVRTESGKKMSKSDPSTIIDPLEMIDKYGADALRLALVSGVSAGNDQRLGQGRIIANRNFCNKLWNIARYIEANTDGVADEPKPQSLADHWIINKLSFTSKKISSDLENFRFSDAYDRLYHFVWDNLADWYIEASKTENNPPVLAWALESTLIMAHPFAPFVTESIWQELAWRKTLLAVVELPEFIAADESKAKNFEALIKLIGEARRVSKLLGLKKPGLTFVDDSLLEQNSELIARLAGLASVKRTERGKGLKLSMSGRSAWLDVDEATASGYVSSLEDKKKEITDSINRLRGRLDNKNYVDKAPAELVEQSKNELASQEKLLVELERELASLKA
ncbi:MAG TPA: valine--tRNA ligase [Candidatus Saccharimonadales bacterium]|nr:valine--tRNA ligase [Candidatus Saccharimonadales bacterium]